MNEKELSVPCPDDWATTCAIFGLDETTSVHPFGINGDKVKACHEVKVLRHDSALIFRHPSNTFKTPTFLYESLSSEHDSPIFLLEFLYTKQIDHHTLERCNIILLKYSSPPWPRDAKLVWWEWIRKRVDLILLQEPLSFSVLNFFEHQALDLFRTDETDASQHPQSYSTALTAFQFSPRLDLQKRNKLKYIQNIDNASRAILLPQWNIETPLDQLVNNLILSDWEKWTHIECPICFDSILASHAFMITCGHYFCYECLGQYAKTIVQEITKYRQNPFICPVLSCRRSIKIVGCIKKVLSQKDMDSVRSWYKDIKTPKSLLLSNCLKCKSRDTIRKVTLDSEKVKCDDCHGEWCELCLKRWKGDHFECDQFPLLRLCDRYRVASDDVKLKCKIRWPWLPEYAAARSIDDAVISWVHKFASQCPNCHTGIERSEGCFHMNCTQCNTHFCYECGSELFPPYYGTHHCWEKKDEETGNQQHPEGFWDQEGAFFGAHLFR